MAKRTTSDKTCARPDFIGSESQFQDSLIMITSQVKYLQSFHHHVKGKISVSDKLNRFCLY